MPTTIVRMPQLGESISEGTIGRWLKQPGDRIERDEPLVEVQTDKVNAEVPSPVAGIVQRLLQPEGITVAVQTEIAEIGDTPVETGTSAPPATAPAHAAPTSAPAEPATVSTASATGQPTARASHPFEFDDSPGAGGGVVSSAREGAAEPGEDGADAPRRFYTPVVLRMAQEHGLDLEQVQGSGLGGRVTRRDVERVLAERRTGQSLPPAEPAPARMPAQAPSAVQTAPPPVATAPIASQPGAAPASLPSIPSGVDGGDVRGLTPMRRAIAQHMARARTEIPDAWSLVEIDVSRLVRLRASAQAEWQAREGYELTYLPFFVKAVVAALKAVPELNATWAGDAYRVWSRHDLGIAVSVEQGLLVPVLRNADQLSVAGTASALRTIIQKARGGKLALEDLQGATFTVNNPGALGSVVSQPIVPLGQAGIVTMESIVKRPVVVTDADGGDTIAVRSMMNACLSFDHRILDGAQALAFLRTLKQQVEAARFTLY